MAAWPYSTARWRHLRRQKLNASPLCEPCRSLGRVVAANTVDHIISIASGGEAFPALTGLTSMCASCHSRKTSAVDRPDRAAGHGVIRGCDADGRPLRGEGRFEKANASLTDVPQSHRVGRF
jgi:hypothetical protein